MLFDCIADVNTVKLTSGIRVIWMHSEGSRQVGSWRSIRRKKRFAMRNSALLSFKAISVTLL